MVGLPPALQVEPSHSVRVQRKRAPAKIRAYNVGELSGSTVERLQRWHQTWTSSSTAAISPNVEIGSGTNRSTMSRLLLPAGVPVSCSMLRRTVWASPPSTVSRCGAGQYLAVALGSVGGRSGSVITPPAMKCCWRATRRRDVFERGKGHVANDRTYADSTARFRSPVGDSTCQPPRAVRPGIDQAE